jgi:hypothetical protein
MFGDKEKQRRFEREVRIEIEILRKLHGDDAINVAREKAARPTNRTARRHVLEEAARRLTDRPAPRPTFIRRLFGARSVG